MGFAHDSQVTGFEVQPVLQVKNVSRRFGGVQALDNVSMELLPGEIHALVGENGAGKSTLVKILTGLDQPDSGDILVNGVRRYLVSSHIARQLGLVAMYQEPIIFPDLDVAENIYAGRFPRTKNGTISWQEVYARAEALFERIGINPGVRTSARDLSVASRQLVEIARALSNNAIVLLMDEPTAVLSQKETGRLFDIVRNLRSQGLTIIFISHRINEIKELADRVTIIRNGTVVTTKTLEDTTEHDIIELMVGRDVNENSKPMPRTITDEVLSIKGLTRFGIFEDVSLTVRAGEIVGLAGFVGAGRSEVARSLFGVDHVDKGEVRLGGELFQPRSPRDAIHRGLAYVPENRLIQGIVPIMTSEFNIVIPALQKLLGWLGLARSAKEHSYAKAAARSVRLAKERLHDPIIQLSGGNQQKAVLARWLSTTPKILILDEPTHGIDIGAKLEVWQIVEEVAKLGVGILVISSEFRELIQVCDRIIVMHKGRVTAVLAGEDIALDAVVSLSGGGAL